MGPQDMDDELLDEMTGVMEGEDRKKMFPDVHVHIHAGHFDTKSDEGEDMPSQEELDEMMKRSM